MALILSVVNIFLIGKGYQFKLKGTSSSVRWQYKCVGFFKMNAFYNIPTFLYLFSFDKDKDSTKVTLEDVRMIRQIICFFVK